MRITKDQLYEAAFKYKKAGIWKKLWDNHVFAVKLPGGENGYISIMGRSGEYNALGLYIGEEGFNSYRFVANAAYSACSIFMEHEIMLRQKCLQVAFASKDDLMWEELEEVRAFAKKNGIRFSGKNAYPSLKKFEPFCHPWKAESEEDMEALYMALSAAVLLSQKIKKSSPDSLGIMRIGPETKEVPLFEVRGDELIQAGYAPIPGDVKEEYEYVKAENEIALAAVKKLPRKGVWETELICMMEPVQDDPEEAPYYPFLLLMVKSEDHYVLPVSVVDHAGSKLQDVIQDFANTLRNEKIRPKEIRCRDERTYALLKDFCEKAGIKICIYDEGLFALDEAEKSLMEHSLGLNADDVMDAIDQFIDMVLEASENELRGIPEEVMESLWMMIESGMLDEDIEEELRRKLARI